MTQRTILFLLLLFLLPTPGIAQEQSTPDKVFNAETFTLGNGMQAIVIPNHRAPVVTHMVWYGVGASDETAGKTGLAHFLEHLMFKGTETIPPGAFSKRVRSLGGNDNAFTNQDYTAYYQSIAVEHLETVMRMEADRMTGLALPPKEVESERNVVIQERRQRTDNDPQSLFLERMRTALFINHPYGRPVIGWLHEIENLDREGAEAFYRQWYGPNNAVLIVSGDITAETLRPLAEKIYGPIPRNESIPERTWTRVPDLQGETVVMLQHPSVRQPVLQRLYRAPGRAEENVKEDIHALEILANIMDGGAAARLYRSLVTEQKIAIDISMDYYPMRAGGSLWLSVTPADDVDLNTVEEALDKEIQAVIENGVTPAELTEAKARMKDRAVLARDSLSGPALIVGRILMGGGTLDDVEYWPAHIDAVTAEQVQGVAKRLLGGKDGAPAQHFVTGYLLPEEE